jgi:hypothetical protein
VLAEHPLDGDRVRPVAGQPFLDLPLEGEQPGGDVAAGVGAGHARLDHRERRTGPAVHHAEAAPGQARVHAEHAHDALPRHQDLPACDMTTRPIARSANTCSAARLSGAGGLADDIRRRGSAELFARTGRA